ncbi:unnamed protein product [Paramecium octaurelia]|uniref:Uncharacterized protein n=1 Tax=Paramecium octaurelia TaxID=43137 RepID=A0A8S1Y6T8_PAROT|nr:unnamed protein product [Paramecium octaurelia]
MRRPLQIIIQTKGSLIFINIINREINLTTIDVAFLFAMQTCGFLKIKSKSEQNFGQRIVLLLFFQFMFQNAHQIVNLQPLYACGFISIQSSEEEIDIGSCRRCNNTYKIWLI